MAQLEIGIALPTIEDVAGPEVPSVDVAARHVEQLGLESVWVADLITGDGMPALEATVALAVAAAATGRVRIGFSVLVLPARSIPWTAAQIGSLQHVSGNRLILGVGAGGFPDSPFWQAVGAPSRHRGRRADAALELLPQLIAGKPTSVDSASGRSVVTLAPAAPVPPILVGGFRDSAASIRRAATYGDGWFPSLLTPASLAAGVARLREAAAARGRAVTDITVGVHAVLGSDDAARSARDALARNIADAHGLSSDEAAAIPIAGSPEQAAERFASYAEAGATRLVVAPPTTNWHHNTNLVAEAHRSL